MGYFIYLFLYLNEVELAYSLARFSVTVPGNIYWLGWWERLDSFLKDDVQCSMKFIVCLWFCSHLFVYNAMKDISYCL